MAAWYEVQALLPGHGQAVKQNAPALSEVRGRRKEPKDVGSFCLGFGSSSMTQAARLDSRDPRSALRARTDSATADRVGGLWRGRAGLNGRLQCADPIHRLTGQRFRSREACRRPARGAR